MNRAERRAAAAKQRRTASPHNATPLPDRAGLLRIIATAFEADQTVSGVTLIEPDGTTTYIDAAMMRRGGRA